MEDETCTEVYRLHVWICRISPMIWRRLLVRSDSTIADLHYTLQTAFGWSDEHFAKFKDSFDRLLYLLDRLQYELPESAQTAGMAVGHLCDLEAYLRKNESGIINYREWRDAGRRISISAVDGTVNRLIGRRMCKSQHMCWTKRGAHLLLQVRCAVFNRDLLAGFQRWFPAVGTRRIMLPWDWLPQQ